MGNKTKPKHWTIGGRTACYQRLLVRLEGVRGHDSLGPLHKTVGEFCMGRGVEHVGMYFSRASTRRGAAGQGLLGRGGCGVAAAHPPLASDMVRLLGLEQSQPLTYGRKAGLVSGNAEAGRARLSIAKLRTLTATFAIGLFPVEHSGQDPFLTSWVPRLSGEGLHSPVSVRNLKRIRII